MNTEPVAWMLKKEIQNGLDDFFEHSPDFPDWQIEEFKEAYIPLYTHPADLTDEEIDTIVRDFFGEVNSFYDFRLVIRRCIRKAQET